MNNLVDYFNLICVSLSKVVFRWFQNKVSVDKEIVREEKRII